MKIRRFLQPIEGQSGREIAEALVALGGKGARFVVVSAWVKLSGVSRLKREMLDFTDSGGQILTIVGVDQRGTTHEGLEQLLELTKDCYLFKDAGGMGRSFHPKFYLASSDKRAILISGSGNFTRGGLYTNYEAFDVFELDLSVQEDVDFLYQVEHEIQELLADASTIKKLTKELLQAWHAEGIIPSEASAPRTDVGSSSPTTSPFGSRQGLPGAPPAQVSLPLGLPTDEQPAPISAPQPRLLRRGVMEMSRGRPGQIQLRGEVLDWIIENRQQIAVIDSAGTSHLSPVVATKARGKVNTRRIELPGIDQNGSDRYLLLEQRQDGSVLYESLTGRDPRLIDMPPSRRHPKPFYLAELRSGRWTTLRRG